MPTTEYIAYITTSPKWAALRAAVRGRCRGICERCHSNPMAHTHHKHYRTLYNESLADLTGLCEECHAYVHGRCAVDPSRCPTFEELERLIAEL